MESTSSPECIRKPKTGRGGLEHLSDVERELVSVIQLHVKRFVLLRNPVPDISVADSYGDRHALYNFIKKSWEKFAGENGYPSVYLSPGLDAQKYVRPNADSLLVLNAENSQLTNCAHTQRSAISFKAKSYILEIYGLDSDLTNSMVRSRVESLLEQDRYLCSRSLRTVFYFLVPANALHVWSR